MKRRLYIATFGCQMNEYDSIRIESLLLDNYERCYSPKEADLIILNTCAIREKAEHKVYSLLGRFKHLKKKNPNLILAVGGCVAQQKGEEFFRRFPYVDIVFGPHAIFKLPEMIKGVIENKDSFCATELNPHFVIPKIDGQIWGIDPVRAYVTVMQGCDNFCTYCIVPYVRGREASRPAEDIIEEVKRLVALGIKEVTLLGQNVNSYGKKEKGFPSFSQLLKEVSKVKGLRRLRFTTSHPKDLSQDLIECFAQINILCPHIHLPVQSGSDRILKAMNRHYTRQRYLELISELRKVCPDISLTTDLIVGFPGESQEDFNQTLSLLEAVEFDQIFAFKYSPRPGTRAAQMSGQVPEADKRERLCRVLELQDTIGLKRLSRFVGKRVKVLVDGYSKSNPKQLCGRSLGNHVVNFIGPRDLIGKEIDVFIEHACQHSLKGKILDDKGTEGNLIKEVVNG